MTDTKNVQRVGMVSLGCPKALVDSERILTQLRTDGYEIVGSYDQADVVVVNTCGFIDSAKQESLETIGEAIDANGKVINVQGEGVVGEFPTIEPGESFEYTSGTPLKTNNGIMQGFYLVSQDNGEKLKIDIPAFSLDSPYNKKNVH